VAGETSLELLDLSSIFSYSHPRFPREIDFPAYNQESCYCKDLQCPYEWYKGYKYSFMFASHTHIHTLLCRPTGGQYASTCGHQSTFTLHCMSNACNAFERRMSCLSYSASCNIFRQACVCQQLLEVGVQSNVGLYRKCDNIAWCYMCFHFDNKAWNIKLSRTSNNRME